MDVLKPIPAAVVKARLRIAAATAIRAVPHPGPPPAGTGWSSITVQTVQVRVLCMIGIVGPPGLEAAPREAGRTYPPR